VLIIPSNRLLNKREKRTGLDTIKTIQSNVLACLYLGFRTTATQSRALHPRMYKMRCITLDQRTSHWRRGFLCVARKKQLC
jgi:hypothetical protein